MKSNPRLLPLFILATFLVILHGTAAAQRYTVTDLGVPLGDTFAEATGVATGRVAGFAAAARNSVGTAFVWTPEQGRHVLKLPRGLSNSAAWAINDFGDAVGQAATSNGYLRALLWTNDGPVIDLGVPKGASGSTAYDVNDFDEVVGTGNNAFVWAPRKGFQDLGVLPGGTFTIGWRINLWGEAVGFGDSVSGNDRAFRWTEKGGMKELVLLPGGSTSEALGNNNFGQIVGASDSTVANLHAVLWTADGDHILDLGALPGAITSAANAINDFGAVVGECDFPTGHAFLWTPEAGMLDLNSLIPANSGWVLNVATFISLEGQISGYGTIHGQTHAFVLTPTER